MWRIYFYLKNKNYRSFYDNLYDRLIEAMEKLVQNSIYYIRMTTELLTKEIILAEEE